MGAVVGVGRSRLGLLYVATRQHLFLHPRLAIPDVGGGVGLMAYRIVRPETAFSKEPTRKRKRPREHANSHLKWVRTLPCVITGKRDNVHAAHIRYGDPRFGKAPAGMGAKPDDKWVVPLHAAKHLYGDDAQHDQSEREFWEKSGIDPVAVAAALWSCSGDDEAAEVILREAREGARK